jgi:hypothetical protein
VHLSSGNKKKKNKGGSAAASTTIALGAPCVPNVSRTPVKTSVPNPPAATLSKGLQSLAKTPGLPGFKNSFVPVLPPVPSKPKPKPKKYL